MNAVGFDQPLRCFVVPFTFDPLNLGEQASDRFAKRVDVGHDVEGPVAARPDLDRRRVRDQPVHNRLAIAHVVFLDCGALADTPQLHERVARVSLVLGAHDVVVVRFTEQAEIRELALGKKIQRNEIRARLFDRRELLFERRLRIAEQMYWSARKLKAAGVRSQHPDWPEEKVATEVNRIFLNAGN